MHIKSYGAFSHIISGWKTGIWLESVVYMCGVVFWFMKATDREIMNSMWLCHEHIVCKPPTFVLASIGLETDRETALVYVCVWLWHILLLSSLPGSARGWAVGHRHHFGHVGLSAGFLSYRQHSLHCHYGKENTHSVNHLHTNSKIR